MNFDDLHDPHPPQPGPAALAGVAARARQLRWRRAALVTAGGLAALAAVVVPAALVVTGDDEVGRIVPATVPPTDPVPVTTTAPPTTTRPAPARPTVVAIRADGDAVRIDPDGTETVLWDGSDPRTPPEEGEQTVVDSVAITPDGRVFVSTCCEPVPGTVIDVAAAEEPVETPFRYGHGLALSPDGTRFATVGASMIEVWTADGTTLASADLSASPTYRQPEGVMWLDDGTLAVIELRQTETGNEFRLYTVDAALTGAAATEGAVIGTDIEATWPRFGGVADDGSILVYRGARGGTVSDTLEAHDPATLERRPASDIEIADDMAAVDAWYRDGLLTWIGVDGALHLGDAIVPGEFAWARPAGVR